MGWNEMTTSHEKPVAGLLWKTLQGKNRKEKQCEKNLLSFYVLAVQSFEVSTENAGVKWDNKYTHILYSHEKHTATSCCIYRERERCEKILIIVRKEKGRKPHTTATL